MRTLALSSRGRRLAATSCFAAALALAGAAAADDAGGGSAGAAGVSNAPVVEQLLDILLQQKSITKSQYDALLEQARREEAAAAARIAQAAQPAESTPVSAGAPKWDFKWDNGFTLQRSDGAYKLRFGGRTQLDGALIWESNGLSQDLRSLGGNGQGNGVAFRRARLFFEGTVYDRLFFKAQYDFATGQPAFKDLYMGLWQMGPVGYIQVGQFKEPFFLDEQTSDDYITFMERPLTDAFCPDRNVGVMLSNTLAEKRMLWQVATFRDTNDVGQAFSSFSSTDWDAVARVTGLPIWADDGAHLLHLGFDYLHRFRGQSVSFSQRPESFLADNFVNTAAINANGTNAFDVELAYVRGPFALQSEYTNALVDGDQNQTNLDFWGVYGQMSYFLTGEHKAYEQDYGRFGRIRPKNNFNPAEGGWGAWEIAARVSYLDLDDENINGGKLLDVLAGINWYLFPNARIMLNYIHAHLTDRRAPAPAFSMGGRGNILQTRFQIDF